MRALAIYAVNADSEQRVRFNKVSGFSVAVNDFITKHVLLSMHTFYEILML